MSDSGIKWVSSVIQILHRFYAAGHTCSGSEFAHVSASLPRERTCRSHYLSGIAGNVSAGFVSVSGAGNILDPSTTPTGATKNFFNDTGANKLIHGWNERQDVVLTRDIFVDAVQPGRYNHNDDLGYYHQHKIARGTVVSSHLLSYDPKFPNRSGRVTFVFDAPIVGLIVTSDRFHDRAHNFTDYFLDSDFLGNPLTIYPTEHYEDRGLELNKFDAFVFSVAGNRLILNLGSGSPGDQIRVITSRPGRSDDDPPDDDPPVAPVPAPPAVLLALVGVASIGLGRLVRRRLD